MTHRVLAGDLAIEATATGLQLSSTSEPQRQLHLDRPQIFKLFEVLAGFSPKSDQNRREVFRVPLYGNPSVKLTVAVRMKLVPATPINISISGMLLALDDPEIEVVAGDTIIVDVESGECRYRGKADVAWCEGDTLGVWFHECQNLEVPTPPVELVELVMKLQRSWLTRRQMFAE